jgi:hypothetical protein
LLTELENLEQSLRQPFMVLRNFVSEEYKRLFILKNLRDIFVENNGVQSKKYLDFVPYNFLYNSVKSFILQSIELMDITNESKRIKKDKIFDDINPSYRSKYQAKLAPKGYDHSLKKLQSLVYIWSTLVLKSNPFSFDQNTIKHFINQNNTDFVGDLKLITEGKEISKNWQNETDFIQKIGIASNSFSHLYVLMFKRYNNRNVDVDIENYMNTGLEGIARLKITDAMAELVQEQATHLSKSEFEQMVNSKWQLVMGELESKKDYKSQVGTAFVPLLNKIGENIGDVKDYIQDNFESFVDYQKMIFQPETQSPKSRIDIESKFESCSKELLQEIKNQYDTEDSKRDLRCVFKLKALANFWLKVGYNLKPKDRIEIEQKINELISIVSYLSLDYNQQIYLADCLDIEDENKDGELWFAKDESGKDRIVLAIRKDSNLNLKQEQVCDKQFYKLKYRSENPISRNEIDSRFENKIDFPNYSQWQDFQNIQLSEVTNLQDYNVIELQFGDQLARNYLFNNNQNPKKQDLVGKLFPNHPVYNQIINRTNSVITGIKLIKPLHKKSKKPNEFYVKLTILHLYKVELDNLPKDIPTIVEGRDTGENIFVTAASFKIEDNSLKVNSMYNPILQSSQIFKQYHSKINDSINSKGYIPVTKRQEYRNKKKFVLEQLFNDQQKIITNNRINTSKLSNYIIYEDNLLQKDKVDVTEKSTLIAGDTDTINDILKSTTLYNHDKIRKQFEQAVKSLIVAGGKVDRKEASNLVHKTRLTGLGLTFTAFSSLMCVNCGTKGEYRKNGGNFRKLELAIQRDKYFEEAENKHLDRNNLTEQQGQELNKKCNKTKFRTMNLHGNSEVAECEKCGFKTLCDFQAGLNLAVFNQFHIFLTSKFGDKEERNILPNGVINFFEIGSLRDTQYCDGMTWETRFKDVYTNRKQDKNSYVNAIIELYQKYLGDNGFVVDSNYVVYNQVIGLDKSFLSLISNKIIQLQSQSNNKDTYFKQLAKIGALQVKHDKTLQGQNDSFEFSSGGFLRHLVLRQLEELGSFDWLQSAFDIYLEQEHFMYNQNISKPEELKTIEKKLYTDFKIKLIDTLKSKFLDDSWKGKKYRFADGQLLDNQADLVVNNRPFGEEYSSKFRTIYNRLLRTYLKIVNLEYSFEESKKLDDKWLDGEIKVLDIRKNIYHT